MHLRGLGLWVQGFGATVMGQDVLAGPRSARTPSVGVPSSS